MPRFMDENMEMVKLGKGFNFSGTKIEKLGATEYTLVTIAVDVTGSVWGFEKELRDCLITAVEACQKSPRVNNLLLRVITFADQFANGVNELHGFKLLSEINPNDYLDFTPGGMTPLCDACYSAVGAMNAYAQKLTDDDFGVNAIAFVITDGGENASVATMKMVREEMEKAIRGEMVESMVSVLVGINAEHYRDELEEFKREVGFTQYVDAGEATRGRLAKLADFVSQSVSSQSQALGTGGPSQNISLVI